MGDSLMNGAADQPNAVTYRWTKVISVEGDGTTINDDGVGAVQFNDIIPSNAQLVEIKPFIPSEITDEVQTQIIDPQPHIMHLAYGLTELVENGN